MIERESDLSLDPVQQVDPTTVHFLIERYRSTSEKIATLTTGSDDWLNGKQLIKETTKKELLKEFLCLLGQKNIVNKIDARNTKS